MQIVPKYRIRTAIYNLNYLTAIPKKTDKNYNRTVCGKHL